MLGIHRRITEAEAWKNDLEDRMVEITTTEQNTEKRMKKNEDSLRDLCDNFKHTNIHIREVQEAEEEQKEPEKISEEIRAESLPHTGKEIVNQVQEAQSLKKDKPKEGDRDT